MMSKSLIAEDVRVRLAQSLGVVERRRADFTQKMQACLVASETEAEAFGQGEVAGMILVDLLIDGASDLAAFGALRDLRPAAREHRRLEIGGRHYSRFGMALAPVLREVMGPTLPPRIASAWCDAFWFIVRGLEPEEKGRARPILRAILG